MSAIFQMVGSYKVEHLGKYITISVLAFFAAACEGGGDNAKRLGTGLPSNSSKSANQTLLRLQEEGVFPELDTSDNLLGRDSNSDGIRDDIGEHINALDISSSEKASIENAARLFQDILSTDIEVDSEVSRLVHDSIVMTRCLLLAHSGEPMEAYKRMKAVEAYTFNTIERTEKYIRYNKATGGISVERSKDVDCTQVTGSNSGP